MTTTKLVVEVSGSDYSRVAKKIEMLDGVKSVSVSDFDEGIDSPRFDYSDADILVKCGVGARKCDVEELLLGVRGVSIKVVT
jgi:hypothetical protein